MSPAHWAAIDIDQILTATGYRIVITTDTPCHIYMRWSTVPPRVHKKAVTERGFTFMGDVRYCFVVFEDNEQEEAGDTLIHTFIKEPWPGCETRYFYFHGTIASSPTPSTTGLFEKHRPIKAHYLYFTEPWTYIVVPPPEFSLYFLEEWPTPFIPPVDIVWTEPWGNSLNENNFWNILADPDPPVIEVADSLIYLNFTGTIHSGIVHNLPTGTIPLRRNDGRDLQLWTSNPESFSLNLLDNIVNMVSVTKDGLYILLYVIIKASEFGWGAGDYGYVYNPPVHTGWIFIGAGVHNTNLVDLFQRIAIDVGVDPDPTGWHAGLVEIAHRDVLAFLSSYLKNNFITLHYSA